MAYLKANALPSISFFRRFCSSISFCLFSNSSKFMGSFFSPFCNRSTDNVRLGDPWGEWSTTFCSIFSISLDGDLLSRGTVSMISNDDESSTIFSLTWDGYSGPFIWKQNFKLTIYFKNVYFMWLSTCFGLVESNAPRGTSSWLLLSIFRVVWAMRFFLGLLFLLVLSESSPAISSGARSLLPPFDKGPVKMSKNICL